MNRRHFRPIYTSLLAVVVTLGTIVAVLAVSSSASTAETRHSSVPAAPKTKKASNFEVCDVAGDTGQDGQSYPVQVAWTSGGFYKLSTLMAEPAPGQCGPTYSFPVGTVLSVEQGPTPGVPVSGPTVTFSVKHGTIESTDPSIDLAMVKVGRKTTVLTITDSSPVTGGGPGVLELCKTAGDQYVTGYFHFSLSGPAGTPPSASVLAGQCNDIDVPSGDITITEGVSFPYAMTSASTLPSTALLSTDVGTQTAEVSVPPSGTTTVFITNDTLEGYAKICKTLDRTQDNVLAGQTFTFDVSATFNGTPIYDVPSTVGVTAGDYGTTACQFLQNGSGLIPLPLGTVVTATEVVPSGAYFAPVGTTVSPSNLNDGSTAGQAVFYVGNYAGSGAGNLGAGTVTQATFTNEALGDVEVCKTSDSINMGTPFQFSIGGVAGSIPVEVGYCSLGYPLPAGTTTITETPVPHVSISSVTGTSGVTVSGNTATVTVPYGTENIVTFDNEINDGSLKICKQQTSSDAGLQGQTFTLEYSYTHNGSPVTGTDPLKPGQCALPITVPVLNSDLTPVQVSITEETTSVPDVAVEPPDSDPTGPGIIVVGTDTVVSQPTYPWPVSTDNGGSPATIVVNSLEGITNVTFTNGIYIPAG